MIEDLYKHAKSTEPKTQSIEAINQHYFMEGLRQGKNIKFENQMLGYPPTMNKFWEWMEQNNYGEWDVDEPIIYAKTHSVSDEYDYFSPDIESLIGYMILFLIEKDGYNYFCNECLPKLWYSKKDFYFRLKEKVESV